MPAASNEKRETQRRTSSQSDTKYSRPRGKSSINDRIFRGPIVISNFS